MPLIKTITIYPREIPPANKCLSISLHQMSHDCCLLHLQIRNPDSSLSLFLSAKPFSYCISRMIVHSEIICGHGSAWGCTEKEWSWFYCFGEVIIFITDPENHWQHGSHNTVTLTFLLIFVRTRTEDGLPHRVRDKER